MAILIFFALALAMLRGASAACALDNCYNKLRSDSASSFCHTYTTAVNTATTGFPSPVYTSCGPSRLSSACSCLYPAPTCAPTTVTATQVSTVTATVTATVTTTVASTSGIRNGEFGLDPWFNGDIINESSYGYNQPQLITPGFNSQWAALFTFPADGIYELDQYVTLPATRTALTLTFSAKATGNCQIIAVFSARGSGNFYGQRQVALTSTWTTYTVKGTTDGSSTNGFVAVEMQCGSGTNQAVYLDAVSLQ